MKIIVIGASHGLGRETVKAALAAGHQVTAFARHPEAIGFKNPRLSLRASNVLDETGLTKAIAGHEAVICALGLNTRAAIGPPLVTRSYVLSKGVENILASMAADNIKRLICVTAIGTADSAEQCTPLTKIVLRHGLRWLFREKDRQEDLIRASRTDWTLIRPAALTNGKAAQPLINPDFKCGLLTQVSRVDVATEMIQALDQPTTYQTAIFISYKPRFGDSLRWTKNYFGSN